MDYSSPDSDDPLYTEAMRPVQVLPILQPAIDVAPAPSPVRTPTSSSSSAKTKRKKVRFACERCRYRRVKVGVLLEFKVETWLIYMQCDGQVPACGNCSKANAPCIDVDSRDMEKRLVRGSVIPFRKYRAIITSTSDHQNKLRPVLSGWKTSFERTSHILISATIL
jgi:hypothetical protein